MDRAAGHRQFRARAPTSAPCWSSRHSDKSSTTPRNIRPRARRSPSPLSATAATSCFRCMTRASGSPRRRTRSSASDSSAAPATRPRARAPIKAPRCRSICRLQRLRANPRSVPMNEANPVVLVVDDEVQIRRFLRAGLELDGFAVQDAETGADALRWATLKPPDLVILDLGLPDMDGAEVLE